MDKDIMLLTGSTRRLLHELKDSKTPCGIADAPLNLIWYENSDGKRKTVRGLISEDVPLFSKWLCDDNGGLTDYFSNWQYRHLLPIS